MSKQLYTELGQELSEKYGVTLGQMFGKPCLKINNKAFAAFHQDQMVFKLGREHIDVIQEEFPGAMNWDPSGKNRPMKDWLQAPNGFSKKWKNLAEEAMNFVRENRS